MKEQDPLAIAFTKYKLKDEELENIRERKTQLTYLKGETLFKQGAFAPYVLYIIDGMVKVYLQTGHEKQINIHLAKAGDFLAFSAVFGEHVYNYSASALTDARICMIDKNALHQLLLDNHDFAMHITSRNYRNESHLLEIIRNTSYKQMRGKLASALLYLFSEDEANESVFHHLTRQDIADFAAISVESAIKFLKEFEKENIIKLDGKIIKEQNHRKLAEISERG
jgi:CRP/FNR family transcriptional regulator